MQMIARTRGHLFLRRRRVILALEGWRTAAASIADRIDDRKDEEVQCTRVYSLVFELTCSRICAS